MRASRSRLRHRQLWRPSVVPGQSHSITLAYNDVGQTTRITKRGFSPIAAQGQTQPPQPKHRTPLE